MATPTPVAVPEAKTLSAKVTPALHERVHAEADRRMISASLIVERAVDEWLKRNAPADPLAPCGSGPGPQTDPPAPKAEIEEIL